MTAETAAEAVLSDASQHAIALIQLQGHEPSSDLIAILEGLDSGQLSDDDAIAKLDAKYKRG